MHLIDAFQGKCAQTPTPSQDTLYASATIHSMDKPFTEAETRQSMPQVGVWPVPGPDGKPSKMTWIVNDRSVTALDAFYNRC